mmetsp:Transcript_33824/g.95933  ORF Transcript_33824/g.95933 Transcript_33824/m.95933 type:complete len:231 (+) Transcript_33824:594-1286(+)
MCVAPSACFRCSAGRRHVGHRVPSFLTFAHPSRQAEWKTCGHLGIGRTFSPLQISSWQTVQILSSFGMSNAMGWLISREAVGAGAADDDEEPASNVCASTETNVCTSKETPASGPAGALAPPEPASAASAPACAPGCRTTGSEGRGCGVLSATTARRGPKSHSRRASGGGKPSTLISASWKPLGTLPGPRSSSLSEDSPRPAPALAEAPTAASSAPSSRSCRAPICLARR